LATQSIKGTNGISEEEKPGVAEEEWIFLGDFNLGGVFGQSELLEKNISCPGKCIFSVQEEKEMKLLSR